jgi:hypothetical protein
MALHWYNKPLLAHVHYGGRPAVDHGLNSIPPNSRDGTADLTR